MIQPSKKLMSLDDAFVLANEACTGEQEHIRTAARYKLGYAVMKDPRLAAPLTRELLDMRDNIHAFRHAVYNMLLTVMENSMGKPVHYPTVVRMTQAACFNDSRTDRAIAGWAILRNIEEFQGI